MAAGDDEGHRRQRHLGAGSEERSLEVAREVVHGDERLAVDEGDALGRLHADEQGAHEARAVRDRDGVEGRIVHPRLGHRSRHDRADVLDVVAGSQLRHHPAERAVDGGLAGDDAGEDQATVFDDRRRRLVAGRLDAQDPHG